LYTTTSADGTRIAYDRSGAGPAIILVGGAFSYRRFPKAMQLAELLSEQFTVFNYDRRGRGDSGDAGRYTVDREIEDLAAVIAAAGGTASAWGWSSGAVLALRAAAAGVPIERLALYEPPFIVDDRHRRPPADLGQRLDDHLTAGDRAAAVHLYLTEGMGAPRLFVRMMRLLPVWSRLEAVAHTCLTTGPFSATRCRGARWTSRSGAASKRRRWCWREASRRHRCRTPRERSPPPSRRACTKCWTVRATIRR
jgi:hypothetical protein